MGPDVNEVNVEAVDRRDELRQAVELRLDPAPVVISLPVARQLFHRRQLHALRRIVDVFLFGPTSSGNASTQIVECGEWEVDAERTYGVCGSLRSYPGANLVHICLLFRLKRYERILHVMV